MGGKAEEPAGRAEPARSFRRQVILPQVHAGGARQQGHVNAIVDDKTGHNLFQPIGEIEKISRRKRLGTELLYLKAESGEAAGARDEVMAAASGTVDVEDRV